jgi:PAS domain S-box-containing protein
VPESRDTLDRPRSTVWQIARLVESLEDYAVFLLDVDGHVVTWNTGIERIKGYTARDILGEHFSIFYTHEDRAKGVPQQALATAMAEGSHQFLGWRVRKDGTRFWADVTMSALRDDEGNHLGYGKVTRDLTQLRLAQEELEMFASSAAHDLQEPLRTISGFAELLQRRHGSELSPEAHEFAQHITSAADRMQRLIGDLLAFARSGGGKVEGKPIAVSRAVDMVLGHLAGAIFERGTTVRTSVPPEAVVLAEQRGVEQVIQNLLSNALKHADADKPEVRITAEPVEAEWRVEICDNGAGVPPDQRETIFEPFTQLRREDFGGTGLGLAICSRIVERLGGAIGVEPGPGGGSRFWFTLPTAE